MTHYNDIINCPISELKEFMRADGIRLVTDASFVDGVGAAAIILETVDMSKKFFALCPVPTNESETYTQNDPYRSELTGILTGLHYIKMLETKTKINNRFIISCDNDRALEVLSKHYRTTTKDQHFDVIRAITNNIKLLY